MIELFKSPTVIFKNFPLFFFMSVLLFGLLGLHYWLYCYQWENNHLSYLIGFSWFYLVWSALPLFSLCLPAALRPFPSVLIFSMMFWSCLWSTICNWILIFYFSKHLSVKYRLALLTYIVITNMCITFYMLYQYMIVLLQSTISVLLIRWWWGGSSEWWYSRIFQLINFSNGDLMSAGHQVPEQAAVSGDPPRIRHTPCPTSRATFVVSSHCKAPSLA